MQTLNKNKPYSTRRAESGATWYCQDGLEYDLQGKAMDKKAQLRHANRTAAEIQGRADRAMEEAKQTQAAADDAIAALDLAEPSSVAEFTAALEKAGVEIPEGSKKADLIALWEGTQ